MAISLSDAAVVRTRKFLEAAKAKGEPALGLRFGVTKTGCSGWQHVAEVAKEERVGDTVFEDAGIRIFVDAVSLDVVDGTEIDVVAQKMLGEQFVFRNPHALEACGCGESFTTTVIPDLPVRDLPSL